MTNLTDKKTIEKGGVLDVNPDAMSNEAESSLTTLNDFRDDEDAIDRLLRDTGFDTDNALEEIDEKKDEFGRDISLPDEVGGFNKPETEQIVDAVQLGQIAENSVALVKEREAVAAEESLGWLNESQNDEDAIDRLLMDAGFDADDIGLVNEFNNNDDADIKEPEITQLAETDEYEQFAESVPELVDDNPVVPIAEDDYMDAGVVDEVRIVDKFDKFSDFNDFSDFNEPEITRLVETDKYEQFAEDSEVLVESLEDKLDQAIGPSHVQMNDLKNQEDAIDRLLLDTGFDSDDELRDDDVFSGFGEIKDDFAGSNSIQEDDGGKTVQAIADSVDFDDDRLAGLFVNAAESRSDQMDDDKDFAVIDEFAQLDEVDDIFAERINDDFSAELDKQEEQTQQAEPEEIAIQGVWEDDFVLPDLDITADSEKRDTWIDAGIEEDKLAGAFNEPDLFFDDGALEEELEKIGLAPVIHELPAEIKPKPLSGNNASVIEEAKNAVLSQIDAESEITAEQYKKHIKDAENKAKKATVFSYVALGFCVVTFIAAVALAVMAYGAKTEILKLIELVSALEQGAGEEALKNPDEDNNVSVEQLNEQSQASSDLGENNPPEVVDEPVAETAEPEAVSKAENLKPKAEVAKVQAVPEAGTAKPKFVAAKTKTVSKSENLKSKAEAAKVQAVSEAGAAKPKNGAAKIKATSKQENLKPKADAVKSVALFQATVDKAVAANKTGTAKKPIAKIETAKKEPVKPTTKALAPSSWVVQLAAYKQESYAKSQAAGFKQKGVPVEVVSGDVNNTAWYRLRVGGFKNKGEAASYAARIKKSLNLSSVSVIDN